MSLSVSIQNVNALSRRLAPEDGCERATLTGKRISTTSRSAVCSGVRWKKGPYSTLKMQVSMRGSRVRERDLQVGIPICKSLSRRKVQAYALQEKHSILSALATTDDSSLSQSSSQDTSGPPDGEIELNYTTVKEIVENLRDAPFLQYVYRANQGGKPARQRVAEGFFEKPESWGPVQQCLRDAAPDGVIMVHRLDRNKPSECCLIEESSERSGARTARVEQDGSGSLEDYWGLLVHGCKVRCNACYLLRTTRQPTPNGFTTYFMLIRAECFGPSIENQFQRASLV